MNSGFNDTSDQNDNWRTPAWLFKALDTEFAFDIDAAADETNTLCKKFIGNIESTNIEEITERRVFCNPPYSNIQPFVTKALHHDGLWVFLLPVRTRSIWFEQLILSGAEFRWLRKRIAFDPPPGVEPSQPRMDTFISILRRFNL